MLRWFLLNIKACSWGWTVSGRWDFRLRVLAGNFGGQNIKTCKLNSVFTVIKVQPLWTEWGRVTRDDVGETSTMGPLSPGSHRGLSQKVETREVILEREVVNEDLSG